MLGRLTDSGNTVIVIEHNLDVIKTADRHRHGPRRRRWRRPGRRLRHPEDIARVPSSYTGQYLRKVLALS